jgi:hypothetical protein
MISSRIFDSASELRRFKRTMGYTVSGERRVSGYILICKLKRALKNEFTDEVFLKYLKKYNYSSATRLDVIAKIDQIMTRIDGLPVDSITAIYKAYEKDGIWGLLNTVSLPMSKLLYLNSEKLEVAA